VYVLFALELVKFVFIPLPVSTVRLFIVAFIFSCFIPLLPTNLARAFLLGRFFLGGLPNRPNPLVSFS